MRGDLGDVAERAINSSILIKPVKASRSGRFVRSDSASKEDPPPLSKIKVRQATNGDLVRVEKWIQPEELTRLGGDPSRPPAEQLRNWNEIAHSNFVLLLGDDPVAFINIEQFWDGDAGTEHYELGRLIVDPVKRRRGFGSTLTRHINASFHQAMDARRAHRQAKPWNELYMRTHPGNQPAIAMLSKMPFKRIEDPRKFRDDIGYIWFLNQQREYSGLLGRLVTSAREKLRLSQQETAFYCGISPGGLNNIETGDRKPGYDVLRNIANVLGKTEIERVRFLLAAVGEQLPDSLTEFSSTLDETKQVPEGLWLISDVIGELSVPAFLDASATAIKAGYERLYFLPLGRAQGDAERLTKALASLTSPEVVSNKVRVYEAPPALCSMRIAILSPGEFSARKVTISVKGDKRVPLASEIYDPLFRSLRECVNALERHQPSEVSGFRKVYPKPEAAKDQAA